MHTGITGSARRSAAWLKHTGENTNVTWVQDTQSAKKFQIWVDLDTDIFPERIQDYAGNTETLFLLSAVNVTPEQMFSRAGLRYSGEKIIGINAIPTFLERDVLEYSNPFQLPETSFLPVFEQFGWKKSEPVASRVGMVTPRIVFMIINEAFYTLQEGTAEKSAIDTAMKLGTNYPVGPFEWCEKAGLENVYLTLEALYQDTHEERYKICPALKSAYTLSLI